MPTADRTDEPMAQSPPKLTKTTVSDCDRRATIRRLRTWCARSHWILSDIARFRGDIIADIIQTHPGIIGGILQESPFFFLTNGFVWELRGRIARSKPQNN